MTTNWKTTAAGILSALLGMSGPATALVAALQAMKPAPDYTLAIVGATLTFVFGVARVWIGLLQNDAVSTQVMAAAIAAGGGVATAAQVQAVLETPGGKTAPSSSTAKLGALMLIALLFPTCLIPFQMKPSSPIQSVGMIACSPAEIQNEVNTILQEATGIIAVADPQATWFADFQKAANLLKVDEANWVKGGAVQDVINVLNDLQGVTALISAVVPYASLIVVLVAGIDTVLAALLPAPSATAGPSPMAAHMAVSINPWRGRATVKSAADSKAQWNLIVKQNPALTAARL